MNGLSVTQKDKGFVLNFNLKDETGQPLDLIAVTEARFRLVQVDDYRNVLDKLATVVSPPSAGKVQYTVEDNDFKDAGNFLGAIVLKYGTTKLVTSTEFFVSVKPAFA